MSNTAFESAVTTKGQITIPKQMRDRLHIAPGDKVKFFMDAHDRLFLLPEADIRTLRGFVKHPRGKRFSIEELNEAAAEDLTARYKRFLKQR